MLKSIKNIFIILLIGFLATGISIKFSPITTVDMNNINEEQYGSSISLKCDANDNLTNPSTVFITHESEDTKELSFYDDYMLAGKIYKNDKFYKSVNFANINENKPYNILLSPDKPHQLSIDLSKANLMLPDGEYKLVITTNAIGYKYNCNSVDLNLKYKSASPYIKALNKIPLANYNAITLYYCSKDESIEQLIGITRFKNISRNILHSTLKELQMPPSISTGLCNISPIGKFNYISTKNSITYIDLPSKENVYSNSKTSAKAMNSLIKTISALSGTDKIKFLVDYKKKDTFFNGQNINKSIKYNKYNRAYLAYDSSKRYFLVDCDVPSINNSDSIKIKSEKIFHALQYNEYHGLLNIVPQNITLINSDYNNKILTLNFSKEFLIAHTGNLNLRTMMIDSILFSFTSIKDVKYISIKVEDNIINGFKGYDFTVPIKRPLYINPES